MAEAVVDRPRSMDDDGGVLNDCRQRTSNKVSVSVSTGSWTRELDEVGDRCVGG